MCPAGRHILPFISGPISSELTQSSRTTKKLQEEHHIFGSTINTCSMESINQGNVLVVGPNTASGNRPTLGGGQFDHRVVFLPVLAAGNQGLSHLMGPLTLAAWLMVTV